MYRSGVERQVVSPDWLAMYFSPTWDAFQKQIDKIVFETGYSKQEVFNIFCECYRGDREDDMSQEELTLFGELRYCWYNLKENFEEKHTPLSIYPDFYDPEFADENDEVLGGFIGLSGAYVLHPMAARIFDAFRTNEFIGGFQRPHRLFEVEKRYEKPNN